MIFSLHTQHLPVNYDILIKMYSREIQNTMSAPVKDGIPYIGTWNKPFEKADLSEIRKPYKIPLPKWARNYRIKEWCCFFSSDNNYFFKAFFCNLKLFSVIQVLVYNKQNCEKYLFRKFEPGAGLVLPQNISNLLIENRSSRLNFCINSIPDKGIIRLDMDITGTLRRPSLEVSLEYNIQDCTQMAVSLALAERRNYCAFKNLASVNGRIIWGSENIKITQDAGSGFFCDYKGFFPYITREVVCSAAGFYKENRRFGFHIAENHNKEPNKNNENGLWIDGKLTPLPPVIITMPYGPEGIWVIQDVEGMVDLTFAPKEYFKSGVNFILADFNLITPAGFFNGMLMTSGGEQVHIKNLFGIGEKLNLRV